MLTSQHSEVPREEDIASQELLMSSDQAYTPPELLASRRSELAGEDASSSRELPTSSDQALTPPELLAHQQSEVGIGRTVAPVDPWCVPAAAFGFDATEISSNSIENTAFY